MNMRLATTTRNAIANAVRAQIDGGLRAGTITFYTGPQPESCDTPVSAVVQAKLGTLTFSARSAPDAAQGTLRFDDITEHAAADATGVATWARIADGTGRGVFDCDVTETGGGGTIELNTVRIAKGGPIRMNTFTIRVGQAA